MDCLVCHDTTGKYKKAGPAAGMPAKGVDLKSVAENVGHSSRASCGACHFNGGGGDAVKHADLSRQLLEPDRNCDVHMGGMILPVRNVMKQETTRLRAEAHPSRLPRAR